MHNRFRFTKQRYANQSIVGLSSDVMGTSLEFVNVLTVKYKKLHHLTFFVAYLWCEEHARSLRN